MNYKEHMHDYCLSFRRLAAALMVAAVQLAAVSCSNPQKSAAEHLTRGETFLKEKKYHKLRLSFVMPFKLMINWLPVTGGLPSLTRVCSALAKPSRPLSAPPISTPIIYKRASSSVNILSGIKTSRKRNVLSMRSCERIRSTSKRTTY